MTVFVETLSKGGSVHCIGPIVKAVDLTARAIVPSCRKARGARTRGRTGRYSAPQEYAAWGLVHIKAARVSEGFCMPYQSMRRDPRIYSCDAGMVALLRIFCTVELYIAYPEACPLNRQINSHHITTNAFLFNVMRDDGNEPDAGALWALHGCVRMFRGSARTGRRAARHHGTNPLL